MSKLLDRERSNRAPKPKKLSDLDPYWWRNKPDVVHKPDLDLMGDSEDDSSEDKETPEEKKKREAQRRAEIKRFRAAQS